MESETQKTSAEWDDSQPDGMDAGSSDSLTATGKSKKKKKKTESGSDLAFFACFPCVVIALTAIAFTIIGFLPIGPLAWFSDFCASLRAQLVIILMLCALPAPFSPQFRLPMLVGCGLFALINFACVVPPMIPKPALAKDVQELTVVNFKIMQLSIEDPATKLEPIIEQINNSKAEVVCVTGIPDRLLVRLNEIMPQQFLNRAFFPREDGYSQAIYSTAALKGTQQKKVGPEKLPVVCTSIHFDWGWFRVILVKLPEATDNATFEKRTEQMKAVAALVKPLDGRKIVLGNFNTTPYAMSFGEFLKETEMSDSRIGVQPNFNIGPIDVLGLLHIPMDHIFVSKSVGILSRNVVPTEGLTHQPLLATIFPADREAVLYKEPAEETLDDDDAPAAKAPEKAAPEEKKAPAKRKRRSK